MPVVSVCWRTYPSDVQSTLNGTGPFGSHSCLLERWQVFRVLPGWRGVLVRAVDASAVTGLTALALMRRRGDRRQQRR